jgi:hypothetical protein
LFFQAPRRHPSSHAPFEDAYVGVDVRLITS